MKTHKLSSFLSSSLGERVILRISEQPRTIAMRKAFDGGYSLVRLHRAFLQAPEAVLARLTDYLLDPRASLEAELRRFCEAKPPSTTPLTNSHTKHCNRYHNLTSTFQRINDTYFHGRISSRIIWGREGKVKRRRSIQFGSYTYDEDLIRIHPSLDNPLVPQRFLDYVVYHEMLHSVFRGRRDESGRYRYHDETFHRFEKRFKHYDWARQWEKNNLHKFLS